LLRTLIERLTTLRRINTMQPNFLCPAVIHYTDRIPIRHTNNTTGELLGEAGLCEQRK
jgi:hypothetical protein